MYFIGPWTNHTDGTCVGISPVNNGCSSSSLTSSETGGASTLGTK